MIEDTTDLSALKVQRVTGYPVVMVTECGMEGGLGSCIKEAQKNKDNSNQILRKSRTIEFNTSATAKLITVFSPEGRSAVSLSYSEMGIFMLQEGKTYSDYSDGTRQ